MSQNLDFLPFTRPTIDEATIAGVVEVLRSGWITSGPKVKEFEMALSAHFAHRPVRVLSSATGGLEIALALADIQAGDEVITTPLSWVATANVIVRAGAKPVFVDIDPLTRNLDLSQIPAAITPRTKAIMPVDLAGYPVDRNALYAIAKQYHLRVIEDAAQSMGANWQGTPIGATGDLISISFHANKNLTTSEGGCLILNHEDEAKLTELYRLQGVERFANGEMQVSLAGGKHNMTDIAARIGLGQLPYLAEWTAKRRTLAQHYFNCWDNKLGCTLPIADFSQSNWHMFQVTLPLHQLRLTRGEIIAAMHTQGIGIGVHYPAIHLFDLYRQQFAYQEGDFPHAEQIAHRIISLPLFPSMTLQDVERVVHTLSALLRKAQK